MLEILLAFFVAWVIVFKPEVAKEFAEWCINALSSFRKHESKTKTKKSEND